MNEISENVITISENVNRGEGTFGKLLTNSEIHDNLNNTVLEIQKLVERDQERTRHGGKDDFRRRDV